MNYKPHGYAEVGSNIVHHVYASDVQVLEYLIGGSDTVKSLQVNGSVYTVPTGRKLVILVFTESHKSTNTNPTLSHGSVVDTEDVVLYDVRFPAGNTLDSISLHVVATAGNYITVDPNGTNVNWIQVIGYEVDI